MLNETYVLKNETSKAVRVFTTFLVVYAFLSGFVFFEPSLAEFWFILISPFLLYRLRTNWHIVFLFLLLVMPMIISSYVGLILNVGLNSRFIIIDIYLFLFFFITASAANLLKKNMDYKGVLDKVMYSWMLAALVNVFTGFYCYAAGRTTVLGINVLRDQLRFQGFFKDPNVLGPFLVPVSIYFLLQTIEKRRNRLINFSVFIVTSFGVLLTFSRAAWLNYFTALGLLFLTLFAKQKEHRTKIVFLLLILVSLFSIFWNLTDQITIGDTVKLKDFVLQRSKLQSYDTDRFSAQKRFVELLNSTSVMFGAGPGNYELFAGMSTHSLFLRYIGERGLFGFSLYAIFWFFIFVKVRRSPSKNFFIPVLMGQVVNSLFIDSLHWRHLWLIIAFAFF